MRGLYWVRTDLRLHDNLALNAFLEECQEGLILWCPTKSSLRAGKFRKDFLEDSLYHFDQRLQEIGQRLWTSEKDIQHFLSSLYELYPFDKLYFTSLSATEEKRDEHFVVDFCQKKKCQWQSFDQDHLILQEDLPFPLENMPFIFTDFRKKIEANLIIRKPVLLSKKRNTPPSLPLKACSLHSHPYLLFHGGEQAALNRLTYYFWESRAILTYKETRNGLLNDHDSSRLSPWLSLGLLSPRMIMHMLKSFEQDHSANESTYWLFFELLWRDYLKFFSRKFGASLFMEDGIKRGKHYSSEKNRDLFLSWCLGKTNEPFINANMIEINSTGWMSNRGRQNVASFLVHQLKIPWTWGAAFFEEHLIDYDVDLNWGNWLYLSGNGSDPRARIFNIKRQAETYDPDSLYQKKWLND